MSRKEDLDDIIRYDDRGRPLDIPIMLGDNDDIYVKLKPILNILERQYNNAKSEEAKDNAALFFNFLTS